MKSNLTIVHTESHRSWGGQESRVLNECLWMKKNGHRVWLAAPARSQIYTRAKSAGLDVWAMSFNNLSAVSDFIGLRRRLKNIAPDVLNTHGNLDAKVGLTAAKRSWHSLCRFALATTVIRCRPPGTINGCIDAFQPLRLHHRPKPLANQIVKGSGG